MVVSHGVSLFTTPNTQPMGQDEIHVCVALKISFTLQSLYLDLCYDIEPSNTLRLTFRVTVSRSVPYSFPFLIARFMGPTWGPSGADRTQVGPMLAAWTLLSGFSWSWLRHKSAPWLFLSFFVVSQKHLTPNIMVSAPVYYDLFRLQHPRVAVI